MGDAAAERCFFALDSVGNWVVLMDSWFRGVMPMEIWLQSGDSGGRGVRSRTRVGGFVCCCSYFWDRRDMRGRDPCWHYLYIARQSLSPDLQTSRSNHLFDKPLGWPTGTLNSICSNVNSSSSPKSVLHPSLQSGTPSQLILTNNYSLKDKFQLIITRGI